MPDAVYDGEIDRACEVGGKCVTWRATGAISAKHGSYIECPACRTGVQTQNGYEAKTIPPHNVPRILTKRPKWAKEKKR